MSSAGSLWFRALLSVSGAIALLMVSPVSGNAASPFVAGELLVQHRAGVTRSQASEVIKGAGAAVAGEIPQLRVIRISVPANAMEKVRTALEKNPFVSFVEPNFIASAAATPNDAQYLAQWHLSAVMAPSGWDLSTGAGTVPIAVIDSGVDPTHPDLAGKLMAGYNFLGGNTDTHDVLGHGTAVAGTAAAGSNNAIGVTGVAWANPVMPLVVLDSANYATYSNIASAIIYAADRGVRVINISIGGSSSSTTLQSAVDYAWNKGAVIFASAMNNSTSTPYYPAACNRVIAVTATTSSDTLAGFSNFGNWVDIAAPGASILTTSRGGGYSYWNGTSFASPIAAGLAALVLSMNPALTATDVEAIIKDNADDLGASGFDQQFGYGRANVYYTLLAAKNSAPQPDTTAPVASITAPTAGATVLAVAGVNVSATDNVGVTKTELYVDGLLIATDSVSPFSFSWDTTKYANGSHDLMVSAYDAAENAGQSAHVSVIVNNIADGTSPAVSINSPVNGATVSGTVSMKITAADNVGVARVELYIDGVLKSTSSSTTLSYSWNTRKAATGAHTITARAFDAAGNVGRASITVFK